jgi:hypothetical protein
MIVATLQDLAGWMATAATGRWQWYRNSRCKYVTLKIDTRSGAYEILDRDGKPITFEELEYQLERTSLGSSREFERGGYKFTLVKNITGTGGYVLSCQTPEPTFVCVCDWHNADARADEYVEQQKAVDNLQGKKSPSEGDKS